MNPLSWIIVATLTYTTPPLDLPEDKPQKQDNVSVEIAKDELLSPREEAQWQKWENEWKKEEKQNESEILMDWLPTSNSQMPYGKKSDN
ncbi:MAG: hypothetical protein MRZ79_16520 [Bacteroidia bacterium]|nr:hypothetical protein [Bacteroidia bacterium]